MSRRLLLIVGGACALLLLVTGVLALVLITERGDNTDMEAGAAPTQQPSTNRKGSIGMTVTFFGTAGGLRVTTVASGGPAAEAGIQVGDVVRSFRAALPNSRIYVYDNNSRDLTVQVAAAAGAAVRSEPLQGKGNVVRRMFADVDADIYILVDGDATYDAPSAPRMADAQAPGQSELMYWCG